ncbi:MAG: Nif3-like dinuclear metal center hexameric protein [Actinomycetales bacterium]|nr:Nif3-like dinuclear metal center hexameric protein [Actinomycetales bacterium]
MPSVADVLAALESRYPATLAADWDAIGLVCGDPRASVRRILLAVDPVSAVAQEAIDVQADLLVTHHPLFLRPVHSVAATSAKGRVVHELIRNGIALTCAHTNADHATDGVSDALATALGLRGLRPLDPLADPLTGTGRVGTLPAPVSLEQFAEHVAAILPATEHGVRVAGDPMAVVQTVAVCGGAGDSLLDLAASQADAYVTSDLRHHRAQDHLAESTCALIDVAHWAGEWPWLEVLAGALREDLAGTGSSVEVLVSTIPTDPWTSHVPRSHPRPRSQGVPE